MSGTTQSATSLPALVAARAKSDPHGTILRRKDRGIWQPMSWADLARRMRQVAQALTAAGITRGATVGILSDTRLDWGVLDLGIQAAGCVAAGYNPAEPAPVLARQLAETACTLLFVEGAQQLDAVLDVRDQLPGLRRIVIIDMKGLRDFADPLCASLDDFLAGTSGEDATAAAPAPSDPAALIYTAGNTRDPRPVLFTHANLMATAEAGRMLDMRAGDERLAFLPMCHVVERVIGFHLSLLTGTISNYVESSDTVPENLQELQPHVLVAPPRFWRRLHARIRVAESEATGLQRWVLGQAMGGAIPGSNLVLRTVRRSLGIDRLRRAVVAYGSLPADVAAWFHAAGVPVVELYGTTESGGLGFVAQSTGADVRVSPSGEIELRGEHIATGYWHAGGTTEKLTRDGWLPTGDAASAEGSGLRLRGRVEHGAAAAAVETALRANPYIADAIALPAGDAFACLIMLDPDTVEPWAQRANVPFTGFASLTRAEPVRKLIADAVAAANAAQGGKSSIRGFRLIDQRFEPGDAELSPVFQLRRAVVCARYQQEIDSMRREA